MDERLYELQQRMCWFINGIGIHGLSWELFRGLSTERLVELYNVEMTYFKQGVLTEGGNGGTARLMAPSAGPSSSLGTSTNL